MDGGDGTRTGRMFIYEDSLTRAWRTWDRLADGDEVRGRMKPVSGGSINGLCSRWIGVRRILAVHF